MDFFEIRETRAQMCLQDFSVRVAHVGTSWSGILSPRFVAKGVGSRSKVVWSAFFKPCHPASQQQDLALQSLQFLELSLNVEPGL